MLMFQNTDAGAEGTGAQSSAKVDTGAVLTSSYSTGVLENLVKGEFTNALSWFGTQLGEIFKAENIFKRASFLDKEQSDLRATLGLGSQKADEFKKLVADGASKFAEIGLEVDKVGATYTELVDVFKTNISARDQDLVELAATAKVTGQSAKDLAGGFRGVGISLQEVGERMTEVAEIARQAGVSVREVSAGVIKNLDKMNIYNFEGGTRGLAKMSAQAARLGIDMDKIFAVVDKVFNPEGAIQTAAALQRLGVSANALLDPLRLMDLSQNDPTELQNQIVNMSKDFVRFNKELGQFEIMPGEKRRLNEIGKELGMTSGELQKMALNAANLDMKMKQIRFPSSIASKEDRELIATLATVNKQGVAEIKVARVDEKGDRTGEYDMVQASQLTVEQLENIKKDQELRGKSMEEIAGDQLSELEKLNTQFDALAKGIGYGVSSRKDVSRMYDYATKDTRELLFGDKITGQKGMVGQEWKEAQTYRTLPIDMEQLTKIKDALLSDINSIYSSLGSIVNFENFDLDSAKNIFTSLSTNIKDIFGDTYDYVTDKAKEFGIGGSTTDPYSNFKNENVNINQSLSSVEQKISSQSISQNLNAIEFKPIDINENIKVDVNVTMDPNLQNQALTTLISQGVEKWFTGAESNNNINLVRQRIMDVENRSNLTGPRLTNKE
jgi:hypothetical protein